jgi:AcrR family transcriptional regulator
MSGAPTRAARDAGSLPADEPLPTVRTPGRPRDERASRAITEATIRQLDDVGYAAMSMESVASDAGVARATVYRRYRGKADLVTSAIAEHAAEIAPGPSDDPKGDLIGFLADFDDRFATSGMGVLGSLLADRENRAALELHRQRVIAPRLSYVRRLLEQAQAHGDLRPDANLDLAIQMLGGSVYLRRVAGVASEPDWAERAVDTIWQGMGWQGMGWQGMGPGAVRDEGRDARRRSP